MPFESTDTRTNTSYHTDYSLKFFKPKNTPLHEKQKEINQEQRLKEQLLYEARIEAVSKEDKVCMLKALVSEAGHHYKKIEKKSPNSKNMKSMSDDIDMITCIYGVKEAGTALNEIRLFNTNSILGKPTVKPPSNNLPSSDNNNVSSSSLI